MALSEDAAYRARVLYGRQRRLWAELEAMDASEQLVVGADGDWPRVLMKGDADGAFQTLLTCLRLRVLDDITATDMALNGLGFASYEPAKAA